VLLGDLRIDPVLDGTGRFLPTKSFRGTTEAQWARHRDLLDKDGMLHFAMGGFVIRTGDRTVLVDLGLGPRTFLGITGGGFLDDLARLGVGPEEVTDVVFTHLHLDHIGWAAVESRPTFGAATYRCARADLDHFLVDHPGEEAQLLAPVVERLETWDRDGTVLPGVDLLGAPGHTPGSTVVVASSGTDRAVLLGDVVHCPVELVDDEWDSLFDVDPDLAARTRQALSAELEGSDALVSAGHFPGLRFGRLLTGQGRRLWSG
jgi:glyoxylase-like metal-dependent hydrolase (beta-lactamase superfamily II)